MSAYQMGNVRVIDLTKVLDPKTESRRCGLTRFNTGGTHEQNPLSGIPIGNNNSVEENETKSGNFIYSNRIFLDSNIVSQYNLPKSLIDKSVADATKFIDNKFKGRND